jgi:RES domain
VVDPPKEWREATRDPEGAPPVILGDLHPVSHRQSGGYSVTQAISAAAFFLDFDGLIVPSARSAELNLVIFTEKLDVGERLKVEASEPVDWSAWRSQHRKRTAK